ncbi:UDP-3-O-acyl-N-acetylglucosamine deacetylase [Fontisubflavum oceani]|uniref:UDP-3-O-acyl-N-acetylglucosamine deacetylase n=1 Tax=Fontisubflavum oceani TaxID=2978973 RepID=UPI0025B4725E|nr:UDP-3-O-acyl-N-acetylglucosamine deacetylase [Fontisubflavum oceani]WJY21456.1 UDP-3-O-acyl-N-acetylglucosamine deacetylase [Fontisubflavum oceani]
MQATLRSPISFAGSGLHTGHPVRMIVRPAAAHFGIWFKRSDIQDRDNLIPARFDLVPESRLCTKLRNDVGVEVSTVEHLMAAFAGCGIHNALVEIDGPEVPILDGSAAKFVRGFLARGLQRQGTPIHAIEILQSVSVRDGDAVATLTPADGLTMSFTIDFTDAAIGRQTRTANLANGRFVRELCDSRTFCRQSDVDAMQASGLALGGVPGENAVVFDGDEVTSPGGLRHADEAVRHKMLDALGDLALAGAPILGHYEGERAGHMLTNQLLRALFATPSAYRLVECTSAQVARLPGVGVNAADLAHVA